MKSLDIHYIKIRLKFITQGRNTRQKAGLLFLLCFAFTLAHSQGTTASRNHDFLDIIGVGGHVASNVTVYLNASGVAADAQYMGARKYREALNATATWQTAVLQALAKSGIKLIAIPPNTGQSTKAYNLKIPDLIQAARTWNALAPNALYAIEGPNEPVNFPILYQGAEGGGANGSFTPVANFQKDWYAAIKADPLLKDIPVWSVSQVGGEKENVGLQYLTIPSPTVTTFPGGTTYADALNMHLYTVFAGSPTTIAKGVNYLDVQLTSDFVSTYRNHFAGYTREQAKTKPKVITEFGYHTGGGPGPAVNAITQAKNLTTGLLNAFVNGYSTVCIYELYDEGDGFGLFSGTGKPRTSALYLHNLTSIMADTGANAATFTPGTLNYTLANLPATALSKLFQKSNGHYQLVLWNNVVNYNLSTQQPIVIAPVNVTLSLAASKATLEVYNPTQGTLPVQTLHDTSNITVSLEDYPLVIDILPSQATALSAIKMAIHQGAELYPNPFNTSFTLSLSPETALKDTRLIIYDNIGKVVRNIPIDRPVTTISRKGLKKATYFYRLINNDQKMQEGKLIIVDE